MRLYIVYLWIYTNTLNPKARTGFLTLANSLCEIVRQPGGGRLENSLAVGKML